MARKKLTFKVDEFKSWINQQLKRTDDIATDEYKAGLCEAIEHVLQKSNRYEGYNDNYWLQKGWQEWREAGEPDFPLKDKFICGPTGQKFNRQYY